MTLTLPPPACSAHSDSSDSEWYWGSVTTTTSVVSCRAAPGSYDMGSMETYNGHVRTPQDAIMLFEACRLGLLPRVQRRLSEKERSQIKSGSVFVWDEREAGMRRWTDGKSWSASRVSGSFLTYREMEGKRGTNGFLPTTAAAVAAAGPSKSSGPKSAGGSQNGDSDEGDGEGPDGYRYKPDGLMKQSFSITTQDGRHLHLISYYTRSHMPPLKNPSQDPQLKNIVPAKGMYPENTVNEPTTMTPVGRPAMVQSPYQAHPPQGIMVAYPWPPGYGYPPPGTIAYPQPPWPPSPSQTPPHHYAYPPPGYIHAPYHQHLPPFPHHAQHPLERPPPTPQNGLPPPQAHSSNGHVSPGMQWPPMRSPGAPPYPQATAAPSPNPYAGPAPVASTPLAHSFHRPNSPPSHPNSNGAVSPQGPPPPYSEPPPLKDIPAPNANTLANTIIPSINALINGPPESREPPARSSSKSPRNGVKVANAMTATGIQRDRGDLKKLDSQLLKS